MAVWPGDFTAARSRKFTDRHSSYLVVGSPPDTLDYYESDDKIFDGLLTLDAMWAVPDRAAYAN